MAVAPRQQRGMDAEDGDVRVKLFIDEEQPHEGASLLLANIRPHWRIDGVRFKTFTDGITNKLVGCFYKEENEAEAKDVVLVRIYGNKTDLLIDRKAELRNLKLLHKVGLAPCIYAVFDNGLAYKYVKGVTLTVNSVIEPKVWKLVAKQMAKMHQVQQDPEIPFAPMLWTKSERFLNLVPEPFSDETKQERFEGLIKPLKELRQELENLKNFLGNLDSPIVFAHNDLLLGNVIYNEKKNKVTFIDYEYAEYNYQAFDIGNHFAEFVGISEIDYSRYPNKEFQTAWLTVYLENYLNRSVSKDEVEKLYTQVNQFVLASHFFWGLWALIQTEYSNIDFDYLEYAAIRFKEYYKGKDSLAMNNCS